MADELVDVVDADDRVVGTAPRSEIRARRLRHRSVYVLVFNSLGQLFVHKRTAGKDVYPGHYDAAAGGVVAAGETCDAAARREVAEELGVRGVPLRRVLSFPYEDEANQINGTVYTCTYDGPVTLQPEEVVSGEWLDLERVFEVAQTQPFCPDGMDALCRYLDRLAKLRNPK
jgi:isopentenyldiphosphate isomerase